MAKTGGVQVSAHVPAVSGNKQNSVIRLGMRRDMVQPMWNWRVLSSWMKSTLSGKGEIEVYRRHVAGDEDHPGRWVLQAADPTRVKGVSVSLVENESLIVSVELRASETDDSPGTHRRSISPDRPDRRRQEEVFTPGSAHFPSDGVKAASRAPRGREVMKFEPVSSVDGYRIEAALPTGARRVSKPPSFVRSGTRSALSVEFRNIGSRDRLASPRS